MFVIILSSAILIAAALLAAMAFRAPSPFLFNLIEGAFTHAFPAHRR